MATMLYCLSTILLFCCATIQTEGAPITAAPVEGSAEPEGHNQSVSQLMWSLHRGVTATFYYARQLQSAIVSHGSGSTMDSESQQFSEKITNGLCQFLAYYNLLRTANSSDSESLQFLLRKNLEDGCEMIKAINNTEGGVNITAQPSGNTVTVEMVVPFVEGAPSSCDLEEESNSLLHHYCTTKVQQLNIRSATANIVNSYAVHGIEDQCDWIAASLPDPHRSLLSQSLNCS